MLLLGGGEVGGVKCRDVTLEVDFVHSTYQTLFPVTY